MMGGANSGTEGSHRPHQRVHLEEGERGRSPTSFFTDRRHSIDAGNTLCKEGVGGELRQFRGPHISEQDALLGNPRLVKFGKRAHGCKALTAQWSPKGKHYTIF